MIDNECNILSNMSKTEFREFRSLMVEMVLHTGDQGGGGHEVTMMVSGFLKEVPGLVIYKNISDMSMHFSQLKHMKNLVQAATDGGR